jgi:RNA polymerase sigma-70 factor, ECF subfamily
MDPTTQHSLTLLMGDLATKDREDLTRVFPMIYEDLRRMAQRYMDGERTSHTLQPTALVNEVFLKMHAREEGFRGEGHALAVAAIAMRGILVDHARRRLATKRGGGDKPLLLSGNEASDDRAVEILELHELIACLSDLDPRRARVVELRFFAGLTNEQIAEALGVARSTVAADWAVARAWLRSQLSGAAASSGGADGNPPDPTPRPSCVRRTPSPVF